MQTFNQKIIIAENLLKDIIANREDSKVIDKFNRMAARINNAKTFNDEEQEMVMDFQMWAEEKICEHDLFGIGINGAE